MSSYTLTQEEALAFARKQHIRPWRIDDQDKRHWWQKVFGVPVSFPSDPEPEDWLAAALHHHDDSHVTLHFRSDEDAVLHKLTGGKEPRYLDDSFKTRGKFKVVLDGRALIKLCEDELRIPICTSIAPVHQFVEQGELRHAMALHFPSCTRLVPYGFATDAVQRADFYFSDDEDGVAFKLKWQGAR